MKGGLTILLGFIVTSGLCCDCHSSLLKTFQKADYYKVDQIYLVEIGHEIDSGVFEVKLIENFKGEFRTTTKIMNPNNDYCSLFVMTGQKWLIYSYGSKGDITTIYACTRSRDIEQMKYWIPHAPKDNKRKIKRTDKTSLADRGDIDDELRQLRELRANER